MNWSEFKQEFIEKARAKNYENDYIKYHLRYAKNLFENSLPIIFDIEHLSLLTGYKKSYLDRAVKNSRNFYRHFTIKKKSGFPRHIYEPLPNLKDIQSWILNNILNQCQISKFAKAYVKNTSIKDAARFHKNQDYVVTIDIENFFGNITFSEIREIFEELGYNEQLVHYLTSLCCLNDRLPQGAPTSPALSNIVLLPIDTSIADYCQENKIRYTRYADDLIFLGDFNPISLINTMRSLLIEYGFEINKYKTRIMRPWQRQIVTGIIVNNKSKLQMPIEYRKKLRQELYYIDKYGLDSHLIYTKNTRSPYLIHLLGIANQILFINPNDIEVTEYSSKLRKLIDNQNQA